MRLKWVYIFRPSRALGPHSSDLESSIFVMSYPSSSLNDNDTLKDHTWVCASLFLSYLSPQSSETFLERGPKKNHVKEVFNSHLQEKRSLLLCPSHHRRRRKAAVLGTLFLVCIFQSLVSCKQGGYWKSRTLGIALGGEEGKTNSSHDFHWITSFYRMMHCSVFVLN